MDVTPLIILGDVVTPLIMIGIAVALSVLASALIPRPRQRRGDTIITTLTNRGAYLPVVIGKRRVGAIFAWAGGVKAKQGDDKSDGSRIRGPLTPTLHFSF